jgi:hypothetical protein
MVTFSCSCKESPLTEIEKIRARTMMRNNRIFQSLGIGALVSMIRKTNGCEEGSTITSEESASAITQGESSDYDPRDDKVIDEEDVDHNVVEKNVKVHTLILFGVVGLVAVCFLCFFFHYVDRIS